MQRNKCTMESNLGFYFITKVINIAATHTNPHLIANLKRKKNQLNKKIEMMKKLRKRKHQTTLDTIQTYK